MTKSDAVAVIVKDARSMRGSRTSMLRYEKALRALGLDARELSFCMRHADYWDAADRPYRAYQKPEERT